MRPEALAERVREVLSYALHFELRDPALEGLTITRVKVSPDLQFVDLRVICHDDERPVPDVLASLARAKGAFRAHIAQRIKLRKVPDLRFHYDHDYTAEQRVSQILDGLHIPESDGQGES